MKASAFMLAVVLLRPSGARSQDAVATGDLRGATQNLSEIRHEIKASERNLRLQSQKERNELVGIERLNRKLAAARRDAKTHRHNMGLVLERLRLLQSAVGKLGAEESADRDFLNADLVALYKARACGTFPALLRAPRSIQARTRSHYLEALAGAASGRVDSLTGDLGQLAAYRREFDTRYRDLRRHVRQVEDTRATVERERRGREAQLRRVRGSKVRAAEAVRQLRVSEDRLQGMLTVLQKEALRREADQRQAHAAEKRNAESAESDPGESNSEYDSGSVSESSAGPGLHCGLPWPVVGKVLTRFGRHLHPVFHIPVFNRGIEIAAVYGSPVRVIAAGTVDYAGQLEGFGRLVVVDHGRGMLSVYGYGSRLLVRKGQVLRQGEVVEDVGQAGGSRRPSLYFEIRRGAKAQDPLRFLAERRNAFRSAAKGGSWWAGNIRGETRWT